MGKVNLNLETRNHDIVTYVPLEVVERVLYVHQTEILAWAYAYHNHDVNDDGTLKVPHFHVVLRLYRKTTLRQVIKWFAFVDENNILVNTRSINCSKTVNLAFEYLLHENDPDKYQYPVNCRKCSNPNDFLSPYSYNQDSMRDCVFDVLNNVPAVILLERYGRDYVIHQDKIYQCAERIRADCARSIGGIGWRELQCDFLDKF